MPPSADQAASSGSAGKEIIRTPNPFDILCGQSKECHEFEGSQRYRLVIDSFKDKYKVAETRLEKMAVTMEIYDLLRKTRSRFLRFNDARHGWEEVPFLVARDKIGHALRFANRTTKRRPKKDNPAVAALPAPAMAATPTPAPVLSSPFPALLGQQRPPPVTSSSVTMMDLQRQAAAALMNSTGVVTVGEQPKQAEAALPLPMQVQLAALQRQALVTQTNNIPPTSAPAVPAPFSTLAGIGGSSSKNNGIPPLSLDLLSQARNIVSQIPANSRQASAKLPAIPLPTPPTVSSVVDQKPAAVTAPQDTKTQKKEEIPAVVKPQPPRTPKNLAFAAALQAQARQHMQASAASATASQNKPGGALTIGNGAESESENALDLEPRPLLLSQVMMQRQQNQGIARKEPRQVMEVAKNALIEAYHKTLGCPAAETTTKAQEEPAAAAAATTRKRKSCSCNEKDSPPPLPSVIIAHSSTDDLMMSVDDALPKAKKAKCCPGHVTSSSSSSSSSAASCNESGTEPWSILQESLADWESDHASHDAAASDDDHSSSAPPSTEGHATIVVAL